MVVQRTDKMLQGMVFELQENYYLFKPQAFRDFLKNKTF